MSGMRPLLYSELQAREDGKGWFRLGEKIRYIPWSNPTKNSMLSLDMQYYCLQFEVLFMIMIYDNIFFLYI